VVRGWGERARTREFRFKQTVAVIKLQTRSRLFVERARFQRKRDAALSIQVFFRGRSLTLTLTLTLTLYLGLF